MYILMPSPQGTLTKKGNIHSKKDFWMDYYFYMSHRLSIGFPALYYIGYMYQIVLQLDNISILGNILIENILVK